jgi:hypothetical protein
MQLEGREAMNRSAYAPVSAVVFALVALGHAYRAALALPLQFGTIQVPVAASWGVTVVAAALSIWGFRSRT